jgi:DNA primase
MAKTYIDTVKYLIYTNVEISGLVEKPDVVGAIFGQTEGLLGDELDLRDLQKNGRIGRIEVDLKGIGGKTTGIIKIPSSLDMVETCIIAAALETVDRVGPCEAKLKVMKVEDTRNMKRKVLVERAKNLLKNLLGTEIPESKEISDMVRDEVKTAEVVEYGIDRLAAGPGIDRSDEVIFVEGRADVMNMLKNDFTNVISIGGAKVQKTIVELSKKKEVTVFLDGDRGGDIILNELVQGGVEIEYIARAPVGKEVEELTRKELIKCIRSRVPFEQSLYEKAGVKKPVMPLIQINAVPEQEKIQESRELKIKRVDRKVEERKRDRKATDDDGGFEEVTTSANEKIAEPVKVDRNTLEKELDDLNNTLRARFYNSNYERINEVAVRDVIRSLESTRDVHVIVFDGIITQRLVDLAANRGVKLIMGVKIGNVNKTPEGIEIVTKAGK